MRAPLGFGSINVDLIYGLPHQTEETFASDARPGPDAAAGSRGRLFLRVRAVDERAHEGDRSRGVAGARGQAVAAGRDRRCVHWRRLSRHRHGPLRAAVRRARARGRRAARSTATSWATPSRPRPTWWRLACRRSATSRARSCRTPRSCRSITRPSPSGRFPIERGYELDQDDEIRRYVITELMCNFRLDVTAVERRFGIAFDRVLRTELAALTAPTDSPVADGLVSVQPRSHRCAAGRPDVRAQHLHDLRQIPGAAHRRTQAGIQPHGMTPTTRRRGRWRHHRSRHRVHPSPGSGAARPGDRSHRAGRGAQPGGHARTIDDDGLVIERGPNGFLDRGTETMALVDRAEDGDRRRRSERGSQASIHP